MSEYRTINADCAVALATLEAESIDLTVTSPPYDSLRDYDGFTFDFPTIAEQLFRVTRQGGVVVWIVNDATINGSETGTSFKQALGFKDAGFNLHDTMIYAKSNPFPQNHNRYEQGFEYMFVLSKGKPRTFNGIRVASLEAGKPYDIGNRSELDRKQCRRYREGSEHRVTNDTKLHTNIFTYSIGGGSSWHPAVFPEKLAWDHIVSWSNEGDTILDPFMGSGTTGLVCAELKRDFIGIEISERWFEYATERIKVAYSQLTLF